MTARVLMVGFVAVFASSNVARAEDGLTEGWSATLSTWGGSARADVLRLRYLAGGSTPVVTSDVETVGASMTLRRGPLHAGAIVDGALLARDPESVFAGALLGVSWDASELVRVDLDGEVGRHRIGVRGDRPYARPTWAAADAPLTATTWLPYVGVRPTVSVRVRAGPARFVLSVAPFWRWDLAQETVLVREPSTIDGAARLFVGGSTYGFVGGVGLELPATFVPPRRNAAHGEGREPARSSVTVTATAGIVRTEALRGGLPGDGDAKPWVNGNRPWIGASALATVGALDVGALYERAVLDEGARSAVAGALAGYAWTLSPRLRVDLLAEVGGHQIIIPGQSGDTTVWLPYVGIRPSVQFRVTSVPWLVASVIPFARFDVVRRESEDTFGSDTGASLVTYEAGGTTLGIMYALGVRL